MGFLNRNNLYAALQFLIVFILGVYVESVANQDLLFTEGLLADELRKKIIQNPSYVLGFFALTNVLTYYFLHRNKETLELRNLYNNICQLIFDNFIKPDTTLENSKFRVSLFKAKKGILFMRSNYFFPDYRTYLVNVGRFQTRQEKKYCAIKFLPDEGAVGLSYSMGELLFHNTVKYSQDGSKDYIAAQQNELNLPKFKVKKLHDKSCSFISCPIKFFKSDEIFGVIVVDCLEPNKLNEEGFRTIENILEHYSVFFNSNGN